MFHHRVRRLPPLAAIPAFLGLVAVVAVPRGAAAAAAGQESASPTITLSCPATASVGRPTRASAEFVLPPGFRLVRGPHLSVITTATTTDPLVEQLLLRLDRQLPAGRGSRELSSHLYEPGRYEVRAELRYRDPLGAEGQAVSEPVTLTVPAR